jgi:dephospho-CoA kinase
MLLVGLTGGIASGKTFVSERFVALGVPVLEADDVARTVVAPGSPGLAAIVERFGAEFLQEDGGLDRRRMRERVFAEPEARQALEAITHPLMSRFIQDWRCARRERYAILSAAILLESGMHRGVDRVLLIDAFESVRTERLIRRDGIDPALAKQMLAAQWTREQRLPQAHDVLFNNDPKGDLTPQVHRLHTLYLGIAGQK